MSVYSPYAKGQDLGKTVDLRGLGLLRGAVIGRYEQDEVKPSVDVTAKIAEVLEVSLDYLTVKPLHGLKDQHTLRRLEEIIQLPPSAKDQILMVVDALIGILKPNRLTAIK